MLRLMNATPQPKPLTVRLTNATAWHAVDVEASSETHVATLCGRALVSGQVRTSHRGDVGCRDCQRAS